MELGDSIIIIIIIIIIECFLHLNILEDHLPTKPLHVKYMYYLHIYLTSLKIFLDP
jgi:hypothetical protein